jgi:hypothetical protein
MVVGASCDFYRDMFSSDLLGREKKIQRADSWLPLVSVE